MPKALNLEKEKHEGVVETGETAQMKKKKKFNYQNKYWICLINGEEGNDQVSKFLQLKDNTHTEFKAGITGNLRTTIAGRREARKGHGRDDDLIVKMI